MRTGKIERYYYLMLVPGILFLILFNYAPMFGVVIAFEKFIPAKGIFGSKWVGMSNFRYLFQIPDSERVFANTLIIAIWKIALGVVIPVFFALLLNEVRNLRYKRLIQTVIYLPHFLSWVILGTVFRQMFSLNGIVNHITELFGGSPIMYLADANRFRMILICTDQWKEFGYGTIVYLAAITAIDPGLYEAATVDGAGRFRRLWHVTLPGIAPMIVLMSTLSLGRILNAGFDQIFNMYTPLVYETADIIDTYVYRIGLLNAQYGLSTALGLFKSVISMALIILSYWMAKRFAGYRIF